MRPVTEGHAVSQEDHTLDNEFLAQVDAAPEIIERFDPSCPPGSDNAPIVAWREKAFHDDEQLSDSSAVERVVIPAELEYSAAHLPGTWS